MKIEEYISKQAKASEGASSLLSILLAPWPLLLLVVLETESLSLLGFPYSTLLFIPVTNPLKTCCLVPRHVFGCL